jgi:hypothetical protein
MQLSQLLELNLQNIIELKNQLKNDEENLRYKNVRTPLKKLKF